MKFFKNKLYYIVFLTVSLLILNQSISFAAEVSPTSSQQTSASNNEIDNLIETIPEYLTNNQYDKFVNVTDGNLKRDFADLFLGLHSKEYKQDNVGFWNLKSIKLLKYKQVDNNQLPSGFVNYQDYINYNDVVTYYVSLDTIAKEDDNYLFTGNTYYLWVFGKDASGKYKLLQWSEPIIQEMIDSHLAFNDGTEDLQKDIQSARLQGVTLNGKRQQISGSRATLSAQYDPSSCPVPSTIKVRRVNLGTIDTVLFYNYIVNVLPNEWTASVDPIESLKTGAMCIKMYGWYHVYYHKYPGLGYDVVDTTGDQVYVPGSAYSRSSQAVNAVAGIGLVNSSGYLFETQYLASGPGYHSGKVSQTGANSLANQGYLYSDICNYYYAYSDKSSGNVYTFVIEG